MEILNKTIITLLLSFCFVQLIHSQGLEYNYKSTVHTFNEAWNTDNIDLIDQVVHPDYFKKEAGLELKGIDPLKEFIRNYRASYEEVKIIYVEEVYGQEKAAINFIIEAIPKKTGKKFRAEGMVIFHFRDGKIIRDHSVFDQLSALKQQGYKMSDPE